MYYLPIVKRTTVLVDLVTEISMGGTETLVVHVQKY